MMFRRILSRAGFGLLLVASLAMSATAFAHRATQDDPSPELLGYLAMGGTLEDLCGDAGWAHSLTGVCEACRISANALAPEGFADTSLPVRIGTAAFTVTPAGHLSCVRRDVTPPTRAPPRI